MSDLSPKRWFNKGNADDGFEGEIDFGVVGSAKTGISGEERQHLFKVFQDLDRDGDGTSVILMTHRRDIDDSSTSVWLTCAVTLMGGACTVYSAPNAMQHAAPALKRAVESVPIPSVFLSGLGYSFCFLQATSFQ